LTLLEGGEIRLNERRYEVERGIVQFVDERRIFPSFDLQLRHHGEQLRHHHRRDRLRPVTRRRR
jgi:hypothetical protein